MNIREAKEYIKDTVSIYLKKDEFGDYRIPVERQRPIFLLGAPGIGKTAIMEQIAEELNIALVSYSMTHHTRQSAIGLPFISEKDYGGEKVSVSEYTMSEIIASVYDTMAESGVKEGILFLDEINCVSETLYPSMLQFLQFKVFGRHRVPDGWVIVTAGNPTEYNRSVREFDVVTLDRLKVLSVEADYKAWREYAVEKRIHPAIVSFLDSKKKFFYHMETTVTGKSYVTARGWEDLSEIIGMYEEDGLKVTESLISQYLRSDEIVREFAAYYDLYNKYKKDYKINDIFKGNPSEKAFTRAKEAKMDERIALVGILLDRVKEDVSEIMQGTEALKEILPSVKIILEAENMQESIIKYIDARRELIKKREKAGALNSAEKKKQKRIIALYEDLQKCSDVKREYNSKVQILKKETAAEQGRIDNMLLYIDKAFGEESNEMLVSVTELTLNNDTATFINTFGSEAYDKYNKLLNVKERRSDLRQEILGIL